MVSMRVLSEHVTHTHIYNNVYIINQKTLTFKYLWKQIYDRDDDG